MAMFCSGLFTTSTPIHEQTDSGFLENSPQSTNLSTSAVLEYNYSPLRKNLFGKRSISENIPDHQFSRKHKLLFSRGFTFSRSYPSSNKETPRTSRSCASSDEPVHFAEIITPRSPPKLFVNNKRPLKQLCDNDSGFCGESPERSATPKSECYGNPLLPLIENLRQRKKNLKEESLVYFKHLLNFSEDKNCADLSISEMLDLYLNYRFQRTGLKPSAADIAFYEKHILMKETNEESEMFLSSWKENLENISADLEAPKKMDFLGQLHKMNAYSIISNILSYLSGYDLQNASCVGRLWRKIILEDENANGTRLTYFIKKQEFKKEMERKKLGNSFPRSNNFRILESIENVQKEQLQWKTTIKEINFDAFIEVGKCNKKLKPMKCPSCTNLSLQNKQAISKYNCLFCGYEFCCNCLKPYSKWHLCASTYLPAEKPPANGRKYLRRL